ncbi:MAG TPA: DegT/DnrJ/EryC1/StrS aminotransferase family protein [Vicinamibacterales bacterium]|nr:DegT/DnrJ/EryC1/StrS aminotransferase family protein [Vicinamibacterales bacterium]
MAVEGGRPVRDSFLPFHRPWIDDRDEQSVVETLRSGWLTTGPKTKQFEKDLATYVGATHCVAVNSCTAALHLALEAVGVGAGDEVITTPMTFAATANVICHRSAIPVFVDVEPDTLNIAVAGIERAITPRTKAIVVVDFAGLPPDMDGVMAIGRRHGLPVIEDAAHSIGAEYRGRRVGGLADLTAFSFYATKNITSGEGGALTTNNEAWAERAQIMSLHGISRDAWKRFTAEGYRHWDIIGAGYKYNMFDLQAALLQTQFKKIELFWERRQALTAQLKAGFADLPEIRPLADRSYAKHAYHLFPVVLDVERLTADRDTIMTAVQKENIGVGVHYRAVHLHPFYRDTFGLERGMFPHAEHYSDRTLSLPFFPRMTAQDANDVVTVMRKVIARYRK